MWLMKVQFLKICCVDDVVHVRVSICMCACRCVCRRSELDDGSSLNAPHLVFETGSLTYGSSVWLCWPAASFWEPPVSTLS